MPERHGLAMELATVIGSLAGILTTISFVPQVIKTLRSKSAKDISLVMMIVLATGVLLWFIYGVANKDAPIIIANLITFILASTILTLKLKYKNNDSK